MRNPMEITINRRRFDISDGVKTQMTPAELAALVGIPAENAIVEQECERDCYTTLPDEEKIAINGGMHFLITRHFVMGG